MKSVRIVFVLCLVGMASLSFSQTSKTSQIDAIVKKEGATKPEWLQSYKATYPKTLDFSWPKKPKGKWNNNKNIGQYLFMVAHAYEKNFRNGVALMYDVQKHHSGNKRIWLQTERALAVFYRQMEDWPRSIYHWAQTRKLGGKVDRSSLALAYFKMGGKSAAEKILSAEKQDRTRTGEYIKRWAEMGELETALKLAESGNVYSKDIAYLAAGNACQRAGQLDRAIEYYDKAIGVQGGGRDMKRNKQRARNNRKALAKLRQLQKSGLADGNFTGSADAYRGVLNVAVVVDEGKIAEINILQNRENRPMNVFSKVPAEIIRRQSVTNVDAVTGATISTEAVKNATIAALRKK